MIYWLTAIR